jgi:hypothetical protein
MEFSKQTLQAFWRSSMEVSSMMSRELIIRLPSEEMMILLRSFLLLASRER